MIPKVPVRRKTRAGLIAALVAPLAALALASSAMATPTGEFANFAQCPVHNAEAKLCLYAHTTAGEFDIGSTSVPITKAITLQGGLNLPNEAGFERILTAANGETISKSPQTVPGGLLKIVAPKFLPGFLQELFNEYINKGITGVTASTELVGTPEINVTNANTGSGTALVLPVRVHLENVFLGGGCYVGSSAKPVTVDFTTGTTSPPAPNKPITGSAGELSFGAGGQIFIVKNNELVNNSFGAPEAEGCGGLFSFLIDPAVDAEIGLPSEPGHNTAILKGSQELTTVEAVVKSE